MNVCHKTGNGMKFMTRQKGNPEGFPFCFDGGQHDGLETERKANAPAGSRLQRRQVRLAALYNNKSKLT